MVGNHPAEALPEESGRKRPKRPGDDPDPRDPVKQLFLVPERETISLQVEFNTDLVPEDQWTGHKAEHVFRGDVIVEYPRDVRAANDGNIDGPMERQRIHLVATSRRPQMLVTVVPRPHLDRAVKPHLAHQPPWCEQQPVILEFGDVHVESSVARKREVLLSNASMVIARWKLLHVGRKRRAPQDIGNVLREEEDFRALDDKDCFEFSISDGEIFGPTKDGPMPESKDIVVPGQGDPAALVDMRKQGRMPRWVPTHYGPGWPLPSAHKHHDEHLFEPSRIEITFKPRKNELYKCRFRIQVEAGLCVDFICRGAGSYDEEDDVLDFHEA